MKTTLSRKISIGLLIASLVFIITCFIMFFAEKSFTIGGTINSTFTSLFVLGFGGIWEHTYPISDIYGGNAAFAIAFILTIIAIVLGIILIYGYASKKFLPKSILNLSVVMIAIMLFVSITVCFTRQTAAGIYAQNSGWTKNELLKSTKLTGNTIALIVFGFLSVASYIAIAAIPYIKNKITKK